jgi:hypothetical protein
MGPADKASASLGAGQAPQQPQQQQQDQDGQSQSVFSMQDGVVSTIVLLFVVLNLVSWAMSPKCVC